jgi:uncharacterized membrane protein
MITYTPLIIAIALTIGIINGRYYMTFYSKIYQYAYDHLIKIMPDSYSVVGSFLVALLIVFIFLLIGLVCSPLIPDDLWIYFSRSCFIGILIGMVLFKFNQAHEKKYRPR